MVCSVVFDRLRDVLKVLPVVVFKRVRQLKLYFKSLGMQ